MRPTKTRESSLVSPLNRIFGTEANVRVLRVLSSTRHPIAKSNVAARAKLDPSGVRRALKELVLQGIVENVGAGALQPVRLRTEHPLAKSIRALFRAEHFRAQSTVDEVRRAAGALGPSIRAVWMIDPVSRTDQGLEVIVIGVLASAASVDAAVRRLDAGLRLVGVSADVTFEVRGYTAADLGVLPENEAKALAAATLILGSLPGDVFPAAAGMKQPRIRTHADLDRRALATGRAIGDRLLRDPTIIERAREYIRRYKESAPPGERKEMEEWAGILETMPPPRLRQFLMDPGPRATRLRQSLPFPGVLSRDEREALTEEALNDETPA